MEKKTSDERALYEECFDLDQAFLDWLRVRLPIYLKSAEGLIDFERSPDFTYNGAQYKQNELIRMMIRDLEIADAHSIFDREYGAAVDEILDIWRIIFYVMWW